MQVRFAHTLIILFQVYAHNMFTVQVISKILTALVIVSCAFLPEACLLIETRDTGPGLRCEDNDAAFYNSSSIPLMDCKLQCIQRSNCVGINYNHVRNYCLLFASFCPLAQPDDEFIILRYVDHDECLRWLPFLDILPSGGAVYNKGSSGEISQLLARGSIGGAVVPGKLLIGNLQLISV